MSARTKPAEKAVSKSKGRNVSKESGGFYISLDCTWYFIQEIVYLRDPGIGGQIKFPRICWRTRRMSLRKP